MDPLLKKVIETVGPEVIKAASKHIEQKKAEQEARKTPEQKDKERREAARRDAEIEARNKEIDQQIKELDRRQKEMEREISATYSLHDRVINFLLDSTIGKILLGILFVGFGWLLLTALSSLLR